MITKIDRVKLREKIPIEKPFTLFIELSNICNFKCKMCPQSSHEYRELAKPLKNMDMKCLRKIIDDIKVWKGSKIKLIHLHAHGEPLLNQDFIEIIGLLHKEKCCERIQIVTNGSLLNEKISKSLVDNEVDEILISIYSVYEEKLKHITASQSTPKEIKNNILRLRDIRDKSNKKSPIITVKMIDTYSKENELFKKDFNGIADDIIISKPINWDDGEDGIYIDKLYKDISNKVKQDIHKKEINRNVCVYPFHTMVIKSDGEVLACCVDWKKNTKIGNIHENSLEEIWNGERLYYFRKMHIEGLRYKNDSCKNCEIPNNFPEDDNLEGISIDKLLVKNE